MVVIFDVVYNSHAVNFWEARLSKTYTNKNTMRHHWFMPFTLN